MEAVPRLPMLSCELKVSPSNTDFSPVLRKYIRDHYHEDPESYRKEIKEVETLRQSACKVPRDFTGCSILKRYYSQLHFLQSRFPMTDEGASCVPFMWSDIYSGMVYNITDIKYEQACILYNIGALHSQLGALDSRGNTEGMKIACTHFQCAAWAFQHLRDTYPQPKGCDMSHDLLTFFINILLAQAQECILEKSMLDSRKSSITAKVAAQVVDYYRSAVGVLVAGSPSSDAGSILDIVGSKTFKGWKKFIEFKMAYYSSISHLYMGIQAEEQQKMGERVAWLQSAFEKLNEAIKLSKSLDRDDLNEALSFTMDVIGGKHNSAKKENEFVYHEKVPPIENLAEVKGASLVKGIPFSPTDTDVCGEDIFARLVPMEAHEASSLYSEEKAKILRSVAAKVEDKDQELMTYMSSLQLDKSMLNKDCEKIPQELLEKCAAMSVRPEAVSNIVELMKGLMDVSKDVGVSLKMSQDLLTEEEIKEKNHQEAFGKRAPSMIIVELNKECSKYQEAHERALDSNQTLQKAINLHLNNLNMLISPLDDLMKMLPSVSTSNSPTNENLMQELQHLLDKVDEMRHQRHVLENQLRESLKNDDITKLLVTQDKNETMQKIFVEELKKHDQLLFYLDQNLAAQDNILCALTQANARFADTRKVTAEILKQRETAVNELINSYEAYEELLLKVQKGLEFYQKLQTNVSRLLTRIRSVTHVQDDERTQITEAETRKGSRQSAVKNNHQDSFAPKLKDYLPYLTNRSPLQSATPASCVQSENVASLGETHHSSVTPQSYLDFPYHIRDIPTTSALEGDIQQKSCLTSGKQRLELSTDEKTDFIPVGIRPAPVGSEQTYTTAICTPLVSSVNNNDMNKVVPFSDSQFPIHSAISGEQCSSMNTVKGLNNDYLGIYQPSHFPLSTATAVTSTISNIGDSRIKGIKTNLANQLPMQVSGSYANNPNYSNVTLQNISTDFKFPQVNVDNYTSRHDTPYQISPPIADSTYNTLPLSMNSNATCNQNEQSYISYAVQVPSSLECFQNSTTGYTSLSTVPYTSVSHGLQNDQSYVSPSVIYPTYSNYNQIIPPAEMDARTGAFKTTQFLSTQSSALSSAINISTQASPNVAALNSECPQIYQTIPTSGTSLSWSSENLNLSTAQSAQCQPPWSYPIPLNPNPALLQQNFPDQWNSSTKIAEFPYQHLGIQSEEAQTVKCITPEDKIRNTQGENKNISVSMPQSDVSEKSICAVIKQEEITVINSNQQQNLSNGNSIKLITSQHKAWSENKDLLSSNSEGIQQQPHPEVLQPVKLEVKSLEEVKEKEQHHLTKDPLDDTSSRAKFVAEVEKYEKFVEGLVRKSLNGTTPLDQKWKELADIQDKECRKMSISVARCYPLKNRFPDIMPYDGNRVKLNIVRDDYINASYLKDLSPSSPVFVVTQSPLPATYNDFWAMVWEQQVETLVCLLPLIELKSHVYWPLERGQNMQFGILTVTLQSQVEKICFIEHMISVTHNESRISRVVVHLQFTAWPSSGLPSSLSQLLLFVTEVLSYQRQQRSLLRPVVVHCSAGVGRSGMFCLISALVTEMISGHGPLDVAQVAAKMNQQRKFLIQDKEQLKFCYDAVLYYAQDLLMKRGILTNKASFDDKLPSSSGHSSHIRHPSEDFILGSGGLAKLQSGIAKMGLSDQLNMSATSVEDLSKIKDKNCDIPIVVKDNLQCELKVDENLPATKSKQDVKPQSEFHEQLEENRLDVETVNVQAENLGFSSITSLLDPSSFTLDSVASPNKRRITKDNFANPTSGLTLLSSDNSDPLSQLDPLWTLKKK